jgi:hypothetical protein
MKDLEKLSQWLENRITELRLEGVDNPEAEESEYFEGLLDGYDAVLEIIKRSK